MYGFDYDPSRSYDSHLRRLMNPYGISHRPEPALPPLDPQEADSLLGKLTGGAVGTLQWLGETLMKPGRAVRGVLAGQPGELANLIPFSDTLGITDPAQQVTGRDLLEKAGVLDANTEGLDLGDVAGFGMDVLTDPLTYLTFGGAALSPLGKSAKMAGVLPTTTAGRIAGLASGSDELAKLAAYTGRPAADLAGQALGGHIGIGLPFASPAATLDLSGPLGAISTAASYVPGSKAAGNLLGSLGRGARALFDKSVMGMVGPEAQQMATNVSAKIPAAQAAARRAVHPLIEQADQLGLLQPGGGDTLRQLVEGTFQGPVTPEVASLVQGFRGVTDDLLKRAQDVGLADMPLQDVIGYAPRQASLEGQGLASLGRKALTPAEQEGRLPMLKGLPTTGPQSINELTKRADIRQMTRLQAQHTVREQYLGLDSNAMNEMGQLKTAVNQGQALQPAQLERLKDLEARFVQGQDLADWVRTLPEEHVTHQIGFFDNHPLADLMQKATRDETRILKAQGLHDGIAQTAMSAADAGPNAVPVAKVLEDAGLTLQSINGPGAMTATLQALQKAGKTGALADWYVPAAVAKDIVKFTRATTTPAGLEPFLKIWDGITNLTKSFQTTFWPANWTRNQGTAFFQNWLHDAYDPALGALNPAAYIRPWIDAKALRNGDVVESAARIPDLAHLGPAEATKALAREAAEWDIMHRGHQQAQEVIGNLTRPLTELKNPTGKQGANFLETLGQFKPTGLESLNPLGVQGVLGRRVDTFAPVKGGRAMQTYLDDINRLSVYLSKRLQGFTPEAAAGQVKLAHFDFANLSATEKGVMRRLIPFYSWSRQSIPSVVKELATRPGGKLGHAVRAIAQGERGQGFTPEYLQHGAAIPIGSEQEGTQRYLSSFGLPVEELGGIVDPQSGSATLMRLLGQTNPLIKGPLEMATGKQFFTGRDLTNLYSRTGLPNPIEQILMNSPASRLVTSVGTLADERKGAGGKALNLLTGVKVSDVDMDRQRNLAAREIIKEALAGQQGIGKFETLYARPDAIPLLNPDDLLLLRLSKTLEQGAKKKAQAKQKGPG